MQSESTQPASLLSSKVVKISNKRIEIPSLLHTRFELSKRSNSMNQDVSPKYGSIYVCWVLGPKTRVLLLGIRVLGPGKWVPLLGIRVQ